MHEFVPTLSKIIDCKRKEIDESIARDEANIFRWKERELAFVRAELRELNPKIRIVEHPKRNKASLRVAGARRVFTIDFTRNVIVTKNEIVDWLFDNGLVNF